MNKEIKTIFNNIYIFLTLTGCTNDKKESKEKGPNATAGLIDIFENWKGKKS